MSKYILSILAVLAGALLSAAAVAFAVGASFMVTMTFGPHEWNSACPIVGTLTAFVGIITLTILSIGRNEWLNKPAAVGTMQDESTIGMFVFVGYIAVAGMCGVVQFGVVTIIALILSLAFALFGVGLTQFGLRRWQAARLSEPVAAA